MTALSIGNGLSVGYGLSASTALSRGSGFYFEGFNAEFSPASLFAAGEPGAWYDPSDMTTLFQDSAGTTPVTAVEQPVGLMLDKSKGLSLGPELVTNGTFDTNVAGWTAINSGILSWSAGSAKIESFGANFGAFTQTQSATIGKSYKITVTAVATSGVSFRFFFSGVLLKNDTATGTFTYIVASTSATPTIECRTGSPTDGQYTVWDNISVKELAGNHASQSTSASRPVLSARYNLLTKTEAFDDAAWLKSLGVSVTPNTDVAPDGTTTADTLTSGANQISQDLTIPQNTTYTNSLYFKKTTGAAYQPGMYLLFSGGTLVIYAVRLNTDSGVATAVSASGFTAPASFSVTEAGNYWQLSITGNSNNNTNTSFRLYANLAANGASGAGSQIIWGADLRATNDGVGLPAYQRVNTATDYTTTGFPSYLKFDGVDDGMVTNTITPGVDKAQVFAGVRKLVDTGDAIVAEMGTGSGNGTLYLGAPVNASTWRYSLKSFGTVGVNANVTNSQFAAPNSAVVTGFADISGDVATIRANGVQQAQVTTDQGTGNYLAYPLYLGRRGGTTIPFNGRLYPLIVRFGPNLTETQITNTETWVNGKTKAFAS